MFVFAARWIWAERGDALTIFNFQRLPVPLLGRAVGFGGRPALDVPAIERRVFGDLAQLNCFADGVAVGVAVGPAAADPGEARASPDYAEVGFAEAVGAAGARDAACDRGGGLVRFSGDLDHGRLQATFDDECRVNMWADVRQNSNTCCDKGRTLRHSTQGKKESAPRRLFVAGLKPCPPTEG